MKRHMYATCMNIEENSNTVKKGKLDCANCMLRAHDYTGVAPEALFQEVLCSTSKLPNKSESLDRTCQYLSDVINLSSIDSYDSSEHLHSYPSCLKGLIQAFDPTINRELDVEMDKEVKNDVKFSIATLHLACTHNRGLTISISQLCRGWNHINPTLDSECTTKLIELLVYCYISSFDDIYLTKNSEKLDFFFASLLFIDSIISRVNSDAYSNCAKALEAICQLALNRDNAQSLAYEGLYQYLSYRHAPLISPLGSLCIASLPKIQVSEDYKFVETYRRFCGEHQHSTRDRLTAEGEPVDAFSGLDTLKNLSPQEHSKFHALLYIKQYSSASLRSSVSTLLYQLLSSGGNENTTLEHLSRIDRSAFSNNLHLQVAAIYLFRRYVLSHTQEISELLPTRRTSLITIEAYALAAELIEQFAGETCRNLYQGVTESQALGVPAIMMGVDIISQIDPRWLSNMVTEPETYADLRSNVHTSICTLFQTELTEANKPIMIALYSCIASNIEKFIDFKHSVPLKAIRALWGGIKAQARSPDVSTLVDVFYKLMKYGDEGAIRCSFEELNLTTDLPPPSFALLASETFSKLQPGNASIRTDTMLTVLQEILAQAQEHVHGDERSLTQLVMFTMTKYENANFGKSLMRLVEAAKPYIIIQNDSKDNREQRRDADIETIICELLVCFSKIIPVYPELASIGSRAVLNLVMSLRLLKVEISPALSSLALGSMLFILDNRTQLEVNDPRILVYSCQTIYALLQGFVQRGDLAYIKKLPFTGVLETHLLALQRSAGLEIRNNVENLLDLLKENINESLDSNFSPHLESPDFHPNVDVGEKVKS